MPRVIFVTDLTLWSMGKNKGGPAFTKTVEAYSSAGYDIWLISDIEENRNYEYVDRSHNIVIKPTIFKKWVLVKKIGRLFKIIDHLITTQRFQKKIISIIRDNSEKTLLYAYEIFGVKACSNIAKKVKGVKLITRFQGTIIPDKKYNTWNRLRNYPHYQALETSADLVIMTNDGTQGDRVLKRVGNNSKTCFFMNGLDLMQMDLISMRDSLNREQFLRSNLKIQAVDEPVFLTVSRLEKWKRVERTIDGFADYYHNNKNGYLVVVGGGTEQQNLMERARALGIYDRVRFTGAVDHDDVYSYMIASDCFLSLYDLSNVGNPLLEAMTLGKCIITYDVGDTGRFVQNGVNAILLKKEELSSLGSYMETVAKDRELRAHLGDAAAEYAQKHFWNWKDRMNCELQTVNELLKTSFTDMGNDE